MSVILFTGLVMFFSFFAGFLGALTGLGGGIIIIPVLVLIFHINIQYAMGASLISVMATSAGTTAAFAKNGYLNYRIGIFLEVPTVIGAIIGALLFTVLPLTLLTLLFCAVLFLSAYLTLTRKEEKEKYLSSHRWAVSLKLDGSYPHKSGVENYLVQNVPFAFFTMYFAGMLSGLLGIGSGTLKVLAMDQGLRLPYKVSTTTSNFMIGITAAVSAGVYFAHGFIIPVIAFPVMLGVIAGAFIGAKLLPKLHTPILRVIFSVTICIMGLQMLYKTFFGYL